MVFKTQMTNAFSWCIFAAMETATEYIRIPLETIGERYGALRIIQPSFETAMERSLQQHGQVTPVMVIRTVPGAYEMVDGFKRLRAARKLGYTDLLANVVPFGQRALKAAMITFNLKGRTIAELEQGLVIRSMYREDNLSQKEIGVLLGRHKSYVSRRIALVEKLSDEVLEHLRLGLINVTIGRELSRLPRGNQKKALAAILKYQFTSDESARLVSMLNKEPRWNQEVILGFPQPILDDRTPPRPRLALVEKFLKRLLKMELWLTQPPDYGDMSESQMRRIKESMERIMTLIDRYQGGVY